MSALDEGDGYLGHREIRLDRLPDQIDLEAVAYGLNIFQPDFPQGSWTHNPLLGYSLERTR
jgi:hypothetical protein